KLISVIDSLFVEKIILVEGIRDQAFVNIIIDLINQKSNNYKYVLVIPCNGYGSVIDFGEIFINEFKLKVFLILDQDNKENKREDNKNNKDNKDKLDDKKINSKNYFLFKNELEVWIKEYLEIYLYPGDKNKNDIIQLYNDWSKLNLDYDSFKKKNDECRNLLEKLESFLES
ncbi:MAG: hypothetical protein IIT78_03270, partial [Mycoplasmataceae bacterium]|nr:hypothetical protein [Mycoplasmataceae bacterium]